MGVDHEGNSKGYAFVEFVDSELAKKALNSNGKRLNKRNLRVNPAGSK